MESSSSLSPSNPFYFLEEALKAFFICLGIESHKTHDDQAATSDQAYPPGHAYSNTEDPDQIVISTRNAPKSGLVRGGGGQHF
ncbi:hypothetical protein PanWU01x14_255600 [Parasponia andersonii]|uniref:Uncharacterized protein n=1 Tax=Parasponia andersonii TaxID=3476 RepID=A0A2P5BAU2_PARAD|nr:hypothetical protein PanWU01x14_255600 [Parasponia andersonii]